MWCVISGYGDADFSLSSSQVGDMVSGSWGGVWTTGGEVSGWLTNGTFPCGVAPLEKVCPWKVASGMVGREDPPLFVRKNFKSWMIECLSLHFCTGRNLLRNFVLQRAAARSVQTDNILHQSCRISGDELQYDSRCEHDPLQRVMTITYCDGTILNQFVYDGYLELLVFVECVNPGRMRFISAR